MWGLYHGWLPTLGDQLTGCIQKKAPWFSKEVQPLESDS